MVTHSPYETIKQSLPQLSQSQLKDLFNRCKVLINNSEDNVDSDWLLEGVLDELKLHGIPIPSLTKIKKYNQYSSYNEKSQLVRRLLEAQGNLTKLQKRQLAKISTKCLIEYLKDFTDVSLQNVLTFIDYIPQALERAFPGYLFSHLLLFIIQSPIQSEND